MRLNLSLMLIAALTLPLAARSAFADNLLVNGGFEDGDFTGWSVSETNFLLVAQADTPNGTAPTAADNGYYVFDGLYAAQLGTLEFESIFQQFPVVRGNTYSLTYWLKGDFTNGADNFDTSFGTTASALSNVPLSWDQYVLTFTAPTTQLASLKFTFEDDVGNFLSLDDVDVEDLGVLVGVGGQTSGTDTPEPSSLLLLATGICGLAAIPCVNSSRRHATTLS